MGAARRAHPAGSHPSARRGARWERGPERRGLAALTGRAAEAPARRWVCVCGPGGGGRLLLTSQGGGDAPSRGCGWQAAHPGEGRVLRRTQAHSSGAAALRLPGVTRAGAGRGGRSEAGERERARGGRGGGEGGGPGSSLGWRRGRARAAGGTGAEAGGRGAGRAARMRAGPAPPGLAGLVRAHARCPPEASGCAERARAARRRTCEVSPEEREGGCAEPAAWGASAPHLE